MGSHAGISREDGTIFRHQRMVHQQEHFFGTATVKQIIYVFGGRNDKGAFNDLWAFQIHHTNSCVGIWGLVTPVGTQKPSARFDMAAVPLGVAGDEGMLIYGGVGSGDSVSQLNDMWVYELQTRAWRQITAQGTKPPLLTGPSFARSPHHPPTLYLFGGENSAQKTYTNALYTLDLKSFTWTLVNTNGAANLPSGRKYSSMIFSHIGGGVFVYGGYNGTFLGDLWRYGGSPERWQLISPGNEVAAPAGRADTSTFAWKEGFLLSDGLTSKGIVLDWYWFVF